MKDLGAFFDISCPLNKINVSKLSIGSISNFECNIILFSLEIIFSDFNTIIAAPYKS